MKVNEETQLADEEVVVGASSETELPRYHKVKWYRSTYYNAFILGVCNLLAPGIWGAMNALGGGGAQEPYLVNAANALTFCLMVLSCFFGTVLVRYIGIKWTFILGTVGYAPFAAGLYTHNRYGIEWFTLLGAAICGLSAGIFWMAEAAIALAYPEPWNKGRFLGFWLSFRVGGQIVGGSINLGLNADRNEAGKVSYSVFEAFIALQALGPVVGLLLSKPSQVQRKDGLPVRLTIKEKSVWAELREISKLFVSRRFLLIIPLICQAVYSEAVMYSFQGLWFSVRARALGSFVSGIVALIAGNILGAFLDSKLALKTRSRTAFYVTLALQGGWWIWATILTTDFYKSQPVFDWVDAGFGKSFPLFLGWVAGFQLNYLYLYFVVGNLARDEEEIIRFASLLRGTESAAQAVSYGLSSVPLFAAIGNVYLNFALWAIALYPAWLVVREIGVVNYYKPDEDTSSSAAGEESLEGK